MDGMGTAVAISCSGVSKRFPLVDGKSAWRLVFGAHADLQLVDALGGVSFDVPKGQFVGVMGRNGAGKSTLLRTLGGVYLPDEGRIKIDGATAAIYELGLVGSPMLTGREYAKRLLSLHGFRGNELALMIADIHDFSELEDRFEDPVRTYSAGMSARLFFAVATAGYYDVYLIDEILSVGDQHFQAKCWRRLRERVARGASGVLVTHDWSAVIKLCESAHILERGRTAFSGPAREAVRRYLYGESLSENFKRGIASFSSQPVYDQIMQAGDDLRITARVRIESYAEVGAVAVIERLQRGVGWETILMSRKVESVGSDVGEYELEISVPSLPLEQGSYQINLHLVTLERDTGERVVLDGHGWLNGNGLPLEVSGDEGAAGLALPAKWMVTQL